MGMMTKICKLTFSARVGLFAAACFGINLLFAISVQAANVEKTCAVQFNPCKIHGAGDSKQLYPASRVSSMQSGCINTVPVDQYTRVSEEACLRNGPSRTAAYNHTVNGKIYREHQGMDVGAPEGTKVTAAADGWIAKVYSCFGGGGQVVVMRHKKAGGGCYTSTYMHLSAIDKHIFNSAGQTGTQIKKGTVLALSGRSSCSNGTYLPNAYDPHLHIELRDDPNCNNEKGAILNPACNSINALCDGNAPITEEQRTEFTPMDGSDNGIQLETVATLTGCGKMFSENKMSEFHQHGESHGDAGAFNNCWTEDSGGCSYGASQMVCYIDPSRWDTSTVANYLRYLQKNDPAKYNALQIGGSLSSTIQTACNPQTANKFYEKWKALANSDSSFKSSQTQYIEQNYISYGKNVLKNAGMSDLLNRSPEIDMIILAGAVANAKAMKNNFLVVQKSLSPKTLKNATDEEIISAFYASYAEIMYASYDPKDSFIKRAAEDEKLALESLAIRKAMKEGKTLDEASLAVTGKRACEEGEYPNAIVKSAALYNNSLGGAGGGSISEGAANDKDCSIENYRNTFTSCIFCDVFRVLFNTASSIAKKSFGILAQSVMILVCVGFAIWLCLTIMPFVASMDQRDPRQLVDAILKQVFLVLIVVTLLRMDSVKFFQLAMEPFFNTGFKMAQMVNSGVDGQTCQNKYDILTEAQGAGLPESMGVSILCTIETIQNKILDVMALGSSSICVAFHIKNWYFIPDLAYLLTGLALWVAAFLMLVIYPFLLIDSVLQLCIATALLPAAIGCYAFKFTKNYSIKVWDTFLNCMFNFLFLAIIIFILCNGLEAVLPTGEIWQAGAGSSYEIILEELPWWSPRFLKVVFYLLLGWAVLDEANSFASKFASGIKVNNIGTMVGGLAHNTATQAGIGVIKGSYKVTNKVGGAVVERGKETYRNFVNNRRANRIQNSSRTTTDANGNKVLQRRTWTGRKVTETLQTNPAGNMTLTRAKQSYLQSYLGIGGNKASKSVSEDSFISSKKHYDKNGNLIREEMKMNTAAGKSLLNRNGTRNEVAIHAIRSGSSMSNDDVDKAIMNQMMHERMGNVPDADMNQEFTERNVSRSVDESGREVFTVTQTNTDGSTSIFQMTKGRKRDMLTYTRISKSGKAQSYASDGIINKKSSYKVGADGKVDARSVKNNYAFAKNYNSAHVRAMDSNGRISENIPADEIMMSDEDMRLFQEQVMTYGKDQPMAEFGR